MTLIIGLWDTKILDMSLQPFPVWWISRINFPSVLKFLYIGAGFLDSIGQACVWLVNLNSTFVVYHRLSKLHMKPSCFG